MNSRALSHSWWRIRTLLRRTPGRVKLGIGIGVLALAGLIWQHDNPAPVPAAGRPAAAVSHDSGISAEPSAADPAAAAAPDNGQNSNDAGAQGDPTATVVPDGSVEGARATAQRFATNFATPNGDAADWLNRISPDLSLQLETQYRSTDIRNVPQAGVQALTGPVSQQPGSMAFDVTYTDGNRIEVRVEMGTEGWKVINVLPLGAGAAGGAPAPAAADAPPPAASPAMPGGGGNGQ